MKAKNKIIIIATLTILSLTMIAAYPRGDFSSQDSLDQGDKTPQSSRMVVTPPPLIYNRDCQCETIKATLKTSLYQR